MEPSSPNRQAPLTRLSMLTPPRGLRRGRAWLKRPVNVAGNTVGQVLRLIALGFGLWFVLAATVAPWSAVSQVDLPAGAVADRTLKAPRTLTYISDVRTQAKRDEAANDERLKVYSRDSSVLARQQTLLDTAIRTVTEIRGGTASADDSIRAIESAVDGISAADARQLRSLDSTRFLAVTAAARRMLDAAMQQDVRQQDLATVKDDLRYSEDPLVDPLERGLAVALARAFVKPNMIEDVEKTAQNREAARARVAPVTVTIQEGQTIVRDGDVVTRDHREQLEKLGLLKPQVHWPELVAILGLTGILVVLLLIYLYLFSQRVWQGRQLFLVGLTIALPMVAARLVIGSHPLWVYAFPIATAVMLTAVLLNLQLATVVAMMLSISLGLLGGQGTGSLEYMVLAFVASLVGAFILWRTDRIAAFLWAGGAVGLSVFVVSVCFRLLGGALDPVGVAQLAAMAAFNGGLAAILTFGSFSFLGGMFGITTHLQLLELAHPNQPLLHKLAREAPGTYHHSIVVSNLVESAVELVGGDPLFARVAVLYHDIGKTLRPTFFIENQANRDNVHDALDPKQSAAIILEHVTDGVRLAQKARLPESIVDVIRQHHGTTLLRYFHGKALESGEDVVESDFRYPGPKPQTKEAGVIMLADSVEAAVRSSAQAGKLNFDEEPRLAPAKTVGVAVRGNSKLQDLVNGVIDDLVKRGQLDECALTLRDIDRVKGSFVQVLDGIYHPRIEYPAAPATNSRVVDDAVPARAG